MRAILIQGHCRCGSGLDLGASAFDLGLPCLRCVWVGFAVQTAEQLERKTRSFFRGTGEQRWSGSSAAAIATERD